MTSQAEIAAAGRSPLGFLFFKLVEGGDPHICSLILLTKCDFRSQKAVKNQKVFAPKYEALSKMWTKIEQK